jgi:hypothetical protein
MIRLARAFLLLGLAAASANAKASDPIRLTETMAIAKEAALLANSSLGEAVQKLSVMLKDDYHFQIGCQSGFFSGPSLPECLLGIRRFARVLYAAMLPKLYATASELLKIEITDDAGPDMKSTEEGLTVTLPYRFSTQEMFMYMMPMLQGAEFRKKVFIKARFDQILQNLSANIGERIEFDPALSLTEKWASLNNIVALAKADLSFFNGPADVFYVTRTGFRKIHEKNLRLQVDLDAEADYRQLARFLSRPGTKNAELAKETREIREKISKLATEIQKRTGAQIECSNAGDLTFIQCLSSLQKFDQILSRNPSTRIGASMILIVGEDEIDEPFDTFEMPNTLETIFAIRAEPNTQSFITYSINKGWLS